MYNHRKALEFTELGREQSLNLTNTEALTILFQWFTAPFIALSAAPSFASNCRLRFVDEVETS